MVILNLVAIASYAIFIELWIYLHNNIANDVIKDKTLLVLGLFPVSIMFWLNIAALFAVIFDILIYLVLDINGDVLNIG